GRRDTGGGLGPPPAAAAPGHPRQRAPRGWPSPQGSAGDLLDEVERPVQILLLDDQGRGKPDRRAVGVLGQHPALGEPLAGLPAGQRGELDAGPQPAPPHVAHARLGQRRQPGGPVRARLGRALSPVASTAITSRPTAQARGWPPNVEPCWPGRNTPRISLEDTTADTGTMPPPSAFPSRYMSGTTSSCSQANVVPVRPRPDWISSA